MLPQDRDPGTITDTRAYEQAVADELARMLRAWEPEKGDYAITGVKIGLETAAMRRVTALVILSAVLSVGCGKTSTEPEVRREAASKFSNASLACLLKTAPARSKLVALRAAERSNGTGPNEVIGIHWQNGERLIARAYSSATLAAKAPTEGPDQQRVGPVVASWTRPPGSEQLAVLARCMPGHRLLVIR